jgi:DNA-binding MarR family transcriptional regulator
VNDFQHCPTEGAIGLFALLIQSGRLAESRLDDALAQAGLTFVKWRALDALVKAGEPVALKRLPAELHCVKSNVTQLVDRLEQEMLVRRAPDPDDRRSIRMELTDAGERAHQAGRAALETVVSALFETFAEADKERLRSLLARLKGG